MSYLEKLKGTTSIQDFAPLLGFEPKKLAYLLFKIPAEKKYTQFTIPKKSGGERIINAPNAGLKLAQRRLANVLNSCIQEIESKQTPRRKPLAHGFIKKMKTESDGNLVLGIHTNARCHRNRRYVLNLDLADFFPSFNFGRVRGFFISNNDFKLPPAVATLIAQIACHQNELPQGSPCSPIITNLITHILDVRLTQRAKKYGCTYSRYADDITFSTNQKALPEKLATPSDKPNQWVVGGEIESIIKHSGFNINPAKTRLQFRPSRQMVTSLVVNKKVNIKSEYYRYARSMCHALFSQGSFFLPGSDKPASIRQLEGILSHIHFIKEFSRTDEDRIRREAMIETAKKEKKRLKLDGPTELYSKFLHFRYFAALERPLILCEGKTDSIYLKAAIKQLTKKNIFKFPHAIDFFPFTRRVSEVMRIHDGADALISFASHYQENLSFTMQSGKYPVIILLDNDEKAHGMVEKLKKDFCIDGIKYDRKSNSIYPVIKNLYVVILPMTGGQDNKIEDFFAPSVLATVLDGKTFSAENGKKFDNQKHYSKQVLATKIVRPTQDTIDFNNFKLILELLAQLITTYQK
ncbi:MAG: retron Ec67 family RNA-directed DNA polymerase/endonuclease [Alphaproteobacteria bacterium]